MCQLVQTVSQIWASEYKFKNSQNKKRMKEVTLLNVVIELLRENSGLNPCSAIMLTVQTVNIKQDTPKEFGKIFGGKNRHRINKYYNPFDLETECALIQSETQSQGEWWKLNCGNLKKSLFLFDIF